MCVVSERKRSILSYVKRLLRLCTPTRITSVSEKLPNANGGPLTVYVRRTISIAETVIILQSECTELFGSSNFYIIVSVFIVGLTIVSSGDAASYNLVEVDHHQHADGRGLSAY
jgi:hypothetical protein